MIGEFGETFVVDWGLAQASFDADDDSLESIKCTPNSCAFFFNIITMPIPAIRLMGQELPIWVFTLERTNQQRTSVFHLTGSSHFWLR